MAEDYYDLLGVDRGADAATIKKAFRKKAMEYHPDRNPDDAVAEQKFKAVNEAYDVLSDAQKRAAYDRFGHAAFEGGGAGPRGGAGFSNFSDIFEEMFGDFGFRGGAGGRASGAGRGADLRYNLEISLEQAFKGTTATIQVPAWQTCGTCNGTGAEPGSYPEMCGACGGTGRMRVQQGFFTLERTCNHCGGTGQIIRNPCGTCGGTGRTRQDKALQVNIPAGVEEGTRIRLSGEGEAGMRGGPSGDLYVFIVIAEHPFFLREGADLYCQVPVRMTTAALGGQIEVPTIDGGRSRISVPAGTQSGHKMRLRGKGMSVLRSQSRGDMYVDIQVETPVNLTSKQREILESFERTFAKSDDAKADTQNPRSAGFFAKVKEFWDDITE